MKVMTKGIALVTAVFLACGVVSYPHSAAATDPQPASGSMERVYTGSPEDLNSYSAYRQRENYSNAEKPLMACADNFAAHLSIGAVPKPDTEYQTVYSLEKGSSASFIITVPANATYTATLIFSCLDDTTEIYEFDLQIDGAHPFSECEMLTVNALWQDDGGLRKLSNGDQIAPAQKHVEGFVARTLFDETGIERMPYAFRLESGSHTVTVTAKGKPFLLAGIQFEPPETLRTYAEVEKGYQSQSYQNYSGEQIVVEAEAPQNLLYRSAYALSAKSDNGTADITPHSPEKSLINYIGGSTWNEPGQEIVWKVTVPESGLYKLGFSFRQNSVNDGLVYRWLKIDGKTPFEEASAISFPYSTKWQFQSFADKDGNDYLVYLEKGERIFSLSVTLADISEVFQRLSDIVEPLNSLYLDMVMITGETPDVNRDYELHKQIPDFVSTLSDAYSRLTALSGEIGTTLQVNGELNGALKNMARIVDTMRNNLYSAHLYIPTYYTACQTLSAWLYDIKNMALSLDQLILAAPDADFETPKAGFFENLWFGIQRFFYSFFQETNIVESGEDTQMPTVKIWVNWGRDQVKVLNTLIQDSFTPNTGINVRVEQVNATLVQGVVSGNSPDLYLHQARTEPVNLAMRGVLYDLKNFSDYEDVLENFQPGAETPYIYQGGCYALPDTQTFYVMFYRSDILERLNISVPKTWDDFLTATGILQRNNMDSYLPYTKITSATTVNTGAGGLSIFPTILLQNGGSIYNDSENATALDSAQSVRAFTFWTDFYTKYRLDQNANFYQKFRAGTIPLGIAAYTEYLTFSVTAPEIGGKWKIAEIPGEMSDGGFSNVCSGAGTGCSIMKSSENKDAAWEFLKWWVSADTQYRYSAENEAILGESGRVATANVEALSRLSWDDESLSVILSQWEKVTEIPEVPGSYFVSRAIDQAFWEVMNEKSSPKEAITDWAAICDKEISRKIEEYEKKDPEDLS